MNATSLYVSTCRLVLQANPEDPGCWADLYRLIPYLRQSLSCTVCGNLLIEPYTPTETNCQHHVCRSCKGGKKKLKPSCSWCKNYEKYVENVQLRILLQCYKKLCEYIVNSSIYRLMCKTTATGDTNIANMTDLIQEGAGFKDEFKSNSGLSKSAYSILPCIYASASTQTITQAININNDSEIGLDEDVSVAKSNLSNGSSVYSVTYAGSGNKMVIKRKAMLSKGEVENCENLRLLKGSNFKRPIHRRGTFRGRGRSLKEEEKTNRTGVSNCTVSSNNLSNKRVNVKKKKLGCRCGNATASPGKLTCCGQRCPCYVDSKACLDCKCRGCRNPHTKEGQKVIRDPLDSANSKLQSPTQLQAEEGIPMKKPGNLGYGTSHPIEAEVFITTEPDESEDSSIKENLKKITLTVENLDNIDEGKVKEIIVKIEFMGKVLHQSLQIPVVQDEAKIQLTTTLNAGNVSSQFLDDLLSNPILLTILDGTRPSTASGSIPGQSPAADAKKKPSKASNSPAPILKSANYGILGMCNLDIGNFATGEKVIKKTLLLEPDTRTATQDLKTWGKLPRLSVFATSGEAPLVPESTSKFNNAMGITIESVYNVPEYIPNGSIFEASIPLPSVGEKTNKVVFPYGAVVLNDKFPYRKKWWALSHLEDAGARSMYRISQSYSDVFSTLPPDVDIESEIQNSRRAIRWNVWKNCLLLKNDVNHFYNKLLKHRVWPIEIYLPQKSKEYVAKEKTAKSDKKSKHETSLSSAHLEHFMAFLDLSPLLHPGVKKVRVAAQLMNYSHTELLNKFDSEFVTEFGLISQSQLSVAINKGKSGSMKSSEIHQESSSALLFSDDEEPTFIIVELELLHPFIMKRNIDILETDLREHLCLKEKMKPKKSTFGLAKDSFAQSITNMISILSDEYNNYVSYMPRKNSDVSEASVEFEKYLHSQENFYRMKSTLERAVIDLIKERYGAVTPYEEKIPEIYVYLVNEMHKITNSCALGQAEFPERNFYTDNLQLFAEEAFEEGDYNVAKDYLFLKIAKNTANPDYWLDYAVFCTSLKMYEDAIEATREALALEFQHQLGLLIYGLLMAKYMNTSITEITFEILLSKYPDFVEGWVIFSLIYTVFGNYEGAQVALREAIKVEYENNQEVESDEDSFESEQDEFTFTVHQCRNNPAVGQKYGLGSFRNGNSCAEPLSWTVTFGPPGNIFMKTAILLHKLGFYEYAALSLAEGLMGEKKHGKLSPQYIYYTAVNYYLQGRYEEAIPLLQKTVRDYGKDCFIWSLLGHCYYKLENHAEAISCYEYVKESYNRPNDIHLIYSRIGFYCLQVNKFKCAKQTLLSGCKFSPTPKLWKGVGMACLELEEAEEAEIAFSEANYLDNRDPETWAYLALTNAVLRRIDLFQQCSDEAKKRNLKNQDLLNKINCCMNLNDLVEEGLC